MQKANKSLPANPTLTFICLLAGKLSKDSFANLRSVQTSTTVGCYYCCKIYPSTELKEFVSEAKGKTALCPHCGIDSVLANTKRRTLNEQLLNLLRVCNFEFGVCYKSVDGKLKRKALPKDELKNRRHKAFEAYKAYRNTKLEAVPEFSASGDEPEFDYKDGKGE